MSDNKLVLELGARLDSAFQSVFSSAQSKIHALGEELAELKYKQELIKKFELQTQQVETAKQRLAEARQKVDELREAAANDPTGGMAKKLEAAEQKAEKLAQSLEKTETALGRTKERMQEAGLSSENTAQQLEQLAKQSEKVEKAISAQEAAMQRNGHVMSQMKLSVLDVADSYSGLSAKLLATKSAVAVLSAAVVGAVPVLGQMAATAGMAMGTALSTANVAAMSKELEKLAITTEMSKQSLQEWRLAGRFEGIAAEMNEFGDMSKVFDDMNKSLSSLSTKDGKAFAASMQSIGLSVNELKGVKADAALLKIGDALSKSKLTETQKRSVLAGISEDAANLWPLLDQGAQKLSEITRYAEAVGAIQSDAELAAMKQTNTELSYFKLGLEGVQTRLSTVGSNVVNTLGPNIRQLFIEARQPLNAWGEAVDKTLKTFKSDLEAGGWGVAFSNMFKSAYPTLHQFISSASAFGRGYGQAFVAPMLDELKKGYAGISSALASAGGAELLGRRLGDAMLPVVNIVHNVVGAVKLLISNWETLKTVAAYTPLGLVVSHWDGVVSVFSAVGSGIRKVGESLGLLNPITTASASGVQVFLAALGGLLAASASTKLALGLAGAAMSTFSFALGPLASALGLVTTAVRALAAAAIANPIGATIAVIATGATLIYSNWDKISGWWSGVWNGIQSEASRFANWWSSWTLKEIAADVTFDTVIWAYEKGQALSAWWNSWSLPIRNADVEYGMMEYAYDLGKRFANWWNNLTLKSIIPDIKMPELPSVFEWGRNIGKDLAAGAAEGLNRATSHIQAAEKTANKIPLVMRAALDTHSPSKVTEAIGADTAAGLGLGIEKGEKKVKSAAEKTAQAAADAFKSIMDGIQKQTLQLTVGDEAARRYELGLQGIVGANQNAVIAAEAHIKVLEEQKKKTDKTAETLKTARDELRLTTIERDQGKAAMLREKYELEGLTKVQAAERVSLEQSKTKIEDEIKARDKAAETLKTARDELRLTTIERDQGKAAMLREKYELEGLTKVQAAERVSLEQSKTKIEDEIKARDKAAEALKTARDELRLTTIERDQGKAAMLREKYELEGLTKVQAAERVSLEQSKTKIEEEIKAREEATKSVKKLSEELVYEQTKLTQGAAAAELYKLQTEGYTKALALTALEHKKNTELVQRQGELNKNLGKHLTDSIMSAVESGKFSFKTLADSIKSEFANMILRPVIQAVMSPVGNMLGNSLAGSLGLGKILGTAGAAGAAGTAGAAGGLGGLLGGGAGGLGELVSAIPGWGWALAGVAGLAKLFGGPSDPKLRFTQGATDGQQMLGQGGHAGNAHHYKTAFGTIGATAASDHIGREKDFVPKFHAMMQQMQALDQMIADTMPHHVDKFTSALKGLETSGFSTGDMLKQRYQTVFAALPEELQKAMASGRDITKLTAEEIIAEFGKLSEVAKSGLVTSLKDLGLNLGSTKDSALAAGLGLANLMGGIDKVKAANDFFYQEFFSEEERKAATLKQARVAVAEWNKTLGLSGSSAIKSHEAFRKYAQGLDLSTEAGRKAYAEAMKIAGSLDAVADAALAAKQAKAALRTEILQAIPELRSYGVNLGGTRSEAIKATEGLATLMGGMDKLKSAAQTYYNEFFTDKEKEQMTLASAAAQVALLNKQLGLTGDAALDTHAEVRKYLDGLDTSKAADREKYAAIMSVIGALDKVGDSGHSLGKIMKDLPPEMLKQALAQARQADAADKASKKTGDAVDKATKKISDLGIEAEKMAKPIGKVADNAVTATTNLGTMKTAVGDLATTLIKKAGEISAAAAKAATTTTTTTTTTTSNNTDGSHALGLRSVPFDGYRAVLHKDEAVIPARAASLLRMGLPVLMDTHTNILPLSAANDSSPSSLPSNVTPLQRRVSDALSRAQTARSPAPSVTVQGDTITIQVQTQPGDSDDALVRKMLRALQQQQADKARRARGAQYDRVSE